MADEARFAPSLFDKLTSDVEQGRRPDDARAQDGVPTAGPYRFFTIGRLDRFGAAAMRQVLLRDLGWLFNTANLAGTVDLDDLPHVQTSVLNYGTADLAGQANTRRLLEGRARELRGAIRAFEPRLASDRLDVEVSDTPERDNAVTFIVRSDVVSAIQPLPVAFKTDVEVDSGAAAVRE